MAGAFCQNLDLRDFDSSILRFSHNLKPAKTIADERLPVKDARRTNPENPIIP